MTWLELKNHPNQERLSVCDIMKGNTSEIIKKMEMQIPTYAQIFSDINKEYLHTLDEIFGVCYISEKEFYDKFIIDQANLHAFYNFLKSFVRIYSEQIDIQTNLLKSYAVFRIANIKSYDNFVHTLIDAYSKSLSFFNSISEKYESN